MSSSVEPLTLLPLICFRSFFFTHSLCSIVVLSRFQWSYKYYFFSVPLRWGKYLTSLVTEKGDTVSRSEGHSKSTSADGPSSRPPSTTLLFDSFHTIPYQYHDPVKILRQFSCYTLTVSVYALSVYWKDSVYITNLQIKVVNILITSDNTCLDTRVWNSLCFY